MSARYGLRSSITVRKNAQNWPYFQYLNVVDAVFFAFFGRRLILNGQNGTLTVEILKPKNVEDTGILANFVAKRDCVLPSMCKLYFGRTKISFLDAWGHFR